ncbi:TIGR03546 family protein [Natronospirillum operosum]|nr:TIGR03546 family protein [Natronospirillum operosum]
MLGPFLGPVAKLLKAIASEAGPWQIAWGFALGMLLGVTPFWLHSVVILLLLMVLRVNFASALAGWALFGLFALGLDYGSHAVGEWWLTHPAWQDTWTALYQSRALQLWHFHNTLMLGSWVIGLLLLVPVAYLAYWSIPPLRLHVVPVLQKYHLLRANKANSWYGRFVNVWRRF